MRLIDGKLGLLPWDNGDLLVSCRDGRGSHWSFVENKNRWFSFKNTVSGIFITNSVYKKLDFCVRHHVSGGYEILAKKGDGLLAMITHGTNNREVGLAGQGERGAIWEFLEVGGS